MANPVGRNPMTKAVSNIIKSLGLSRRTLKTKYGSNNIAVSFTCTARANRIKAKDFLFESVHNAPMTKRLYRGSNCPSCDTHQIDIGAAQNNKASRRWRLYLNTSHEFRASIKVNTNLEKNIVGESFSITMKNRSVTMG